MEEEIIGSCAAWTEVVKKFTILKAETFFHIQTNKAQSLLWLLDSRCLQIHASTETAYMKRPVLRF